MSGENDDPPDIDVLRLATRRDQSHRRLVRVALDNQHRGSRLTLQSWHPLVTRPNLVVTSYGIESLGDRTREEVMAQDDAEYTRCREAFDAIVEDCVAYSRGGTAPR